MPLENSGIFLGAGALCPPLFHASMTDLAPLKYHDPD
jgi:hypothetical protein